MSLERYSELLSDADYEVLTRVVASNATFSKIGLSRIKSDPELLDYLLGSEDVYSALFGPSEAPLVQVSPFLGFAVLMHRGAAAISNATFITEWIGPRKRVPLFDTSKVRILLKDPEGRLFLAELLASFTHISSGVVYFTVPGGKRKRRRFSELDLQSLLRLASEAAELDRLQIIKRIGDLSLLLAGVFPDYVGSMFEKSLRFRSAVSKAIAEVGMEAPTKAMFGDLVEAPGAPAAGLRALDMLASSCYTAVLRSNIGGASGAADVLKKVASDSEAARRALNFVSDRYLYKYRTSWFGIPN